jgi:hypothetical protein
MKKYVFVFTLITFVLNVAVAQTFPINEAGIIAYYEIIEVDSLPKDQLYLNAKKWFSTLNRGAQTVEFVLQDSVNGKLVAKNVLSVFTGSGVLQKLSGKFTYNVVLEVKDTRYRYTISDLIYHEYKPDRYHNIQPTGKTQKLEESKALGWQKLWDKHRKTLDERIREDLNRLKILIILKPTISRPEPAKKEVKWED